MKDKIIIYGVFDTFNQEMFSKIKEIKNEENYLIVSVSSDQLNFSNQIKTIQDEKTRVKLLENIEYIDEVIIWNNLDEIETNINLLKIDFSYVSNKFKFDTNEKLKELKKIKIDSSSKNNLNIENVFESKNVITYGTFDLFHIGHENILKKCKEYGDFLIVGVSSDEFNKNKKKSSIENLKTRITNLYERKIVDLVIIEENWEQKKIDIRKYNISEFLMGGDWVGKFDDLSNICKVTYLPRTEGISTTKLKKISTPVTSLGFIIPIYDTKKEYIVKCLDSVKNAIDNNLDIEAVVVDNGSKDKSIFKWLKDNYESDRIKIFQIKENDGKKWSTLLGIEKINSKYIHILNSDDWVEIDNIPRVIDTINKFDLDIYFLNYVYFDNKKNEIKKERKIMNSNKEYIRFEKEMPKNFWHFDLNTILKKEFLIRNVFNFPENVKMYEDVYVNMWALSKTDKIMWINSSFYVYRINQNGSNLSSTKQFEKNFEHYKNMVYELMKIDYKSNKFTYNHTQYHFSLQAIAVIFWDKKSVRSSYKDFINHLKQVNKPLYNELVFHDLNAKRFNYFKIAIWRGWNIFLRPSKKIVKIIRK